MPQDSALYDELGIAADASPEEIRAAYRRKAKEAHPDAPTGSREAFERLTNTQLVLLDPVARQRYDETGHAIPPGTIDVDAEALGAIEQTVAAFLSSPIDFETSDLLALIRQQLKGKVAAFEAQKGQQLTEARRLEMLAKRTRVRRKGSAPPGPNILGRILKRKGAELRAAIVQSESAAAIGRKALELLKDHKFDMPEQTSTVTAAPAGMQNAFYYSATTNRR